MDILFGDDLVWVFRLVSCLVVELKTVIAAHSAKLLAPHQKELTLSLLFSFPFGALLLRLCLVFQEIACL